MCNSDSSDIQNIPSDVEEAAAMAVKTLLPTKSRKQYELVYNKFNQWCTSKNVHNLTENVFLAYFSERGKQIKPSSLWSEYSMIKSSVLVNKNIDLKEFSKLTAYMKNQSKGYHCKKSRVFTKEQLYKFLNDAPDDKFLMMKVVAIFGIAGTVRREELYKMNINDVEDTGSMLIIKISTSKTNKSRAFLVDGDTNDTKNMIDIYRRYVLLRPPQTPHQRLFVYYRKGKCSVQPVGINTFGKIPRQIASYLGLANPNEFTGHCFRRSSATFLADAGADILNLKRHGGWKSSTVAESYVEESINNKKAISNQIFQREVSNNSTCSYMGNYVEDSYISDHILRESTSNQVNVQTILPETSSSSTMPKIIIENCTNCKINIDVHYSV